GLAAGTVILLIAVYSFYLAVARKKLHIAYSAISAAFFISALLIATANGGTVDLMYILSYTLTGSVAVILGAMAGVMGERVGVVNIAIEGQLLAGAFVAALVSNVTGN